MEKINGQTLDIVKDNVLKLKQIFPEVFNEDKVDLEKLSEVLGEYRDKGIERYNFSWPEKSKAVRIAQTPSTGTLRPCREESKNWDETGNLYIEGDNLEVLKLLQKSYYGKVKMIYIDPPYNTGNDFVYKDDFKDNMKNYLTITGQEDEEGNKCTTNTESSGRYHSNWLNMMYPRLKLAKNLLKEDGVIFISIDDNEVDNLRKICDEIFGEDNYVGELIWETATDNNATQISIEHEYILCYSKNKNKLDKWEINSEKASIINDKYLELKNIYNDDVKTIQDNLRSWINANKKSNKIDLMGVEHYNYVDNKGVFYPGNPANTSPGDYTYDIIHPITKKVCRKPDNGYRWPKQTFLYADKNSNVLWGKDETTIPKIKKRIDTATELLKSYYYEDNRISTKYLNTLMGSKVFDNPKSLKLLERLINFVSSKDDIILDFFSGSASTADAIMRLNFKQQKNRKFILVQLPENLELSLKTSQKKSKTTIKKALGFLKTLNKIPYLSEIGKERIRRAGEKIKEENKDKEGIENLDIGFKVFKLDSSNINKWDSSYNQDLENTLLSSIENIKRDRSEEDVLYEVLLKYGIDLNVPIEEKIISDKKVFSIGFGALIACLDNEVTLDVVKGIGKLKEELEPEICRVVFMDNGFKSDSVKTNAVQILKRYNIEDVKSI
ncbi:site-specific DNA-methyltransferase [Clostridium botulinum]|uniref:site-specific DNA-methyltransferase n=1 Tax=Clostridium botulinum TaxID=1491 RepID=UPI00069A6BCE|nr:site-specific DNA-methyltransferase [Clostridium botulinum]KOA78100.1 DNA methylase N-4 [Clostridium botulinum]MCD3276181.1 site-specific DNA-methyltransferase [Clostridium botulinum C/D]MCD3287921.1 site-specific DNA-methyltransferase [Clostridium botulinum C/D]MCD3290025.1 site-specific DNA-methyltransferase [Clostridium botulinum C/D]MCD3304019.1 site-specific DNA-methyltransferase [Clostridium botulinum C/D]